MTKGTVSDWLQDKIMIEPIDTPLFFFQAWDLPKQAQALVGKCRRRGIRLYTRMIK